MSSSRSIYYDENEEVFYVNEVDFLDEDLSEYSFQRTQDISKKFNVSIHSNSEYIDQKRMEIMKNFIENSIEFKNQGWEKIQKYKTQYNPEDDNDLEDYLSVAFPNKKHKPNEQSSLPSISTAVEDSMQQAPFKRGRGRPRKFRLPDPEPEEPLPRILVSNATPSQPTKRLALKKKKSTQDVNPKTPDQHISQKRSRISPPPKKISKLCIIEPVDHESSDTAHTSVLETPISRVFLFEKTYSSNDSNDGFPFNLDRKTSTPKIN